MNARRLELAARRGRLLERIGQQRETLAQHAVGIVRVCSLGDKTVQGAVWLRQHPLAVGAVAFALALARPRRVLRWGQRAYMAWRGWQAIRSRLAGQR